ncbi:MAG TPA: hypothetical protein VJ044_07820 [Candidatus Hodarchaeales archaeon]|nr:hypothetical protein [Candidatus Hodarchaeales archaeon]
MTEFSTSAEAQVEVFSTYIKQKIIFSYFDPDLTYSRIREALDQGDTSETDQITANMQRFLDEDKIWANGKLITLNIENVEVTLSTADLEHPKLVFEIESSTFLKKVGENRIELQGSEQKATYPISAQWTFPQTGRILGVLSRTRHKISGNKLTFNTARGEFIGGHEIIRYFINPE